VGAGTSTITASQAGNSNYNAATSVDQTLTVNRKALTITPDSGQKKVKGASDPTFAYGQTGLVGGDSISGLLSRDAGESVGTYNITQGTITDANNPNYSVSFTTGVTFLVYGPIAGERRRDPAGWQHGLQDPEEHPALQRQPARLERRKPDDESSLSRPWPAA